MESQGTQKTKMHIHTGANSRKICSFTFFTVVPVLSHRISPCRTTVTSVFLKTIFLPLELQVDTNANFCVKDK